MKCVGCVWICIFLDVLVINKLIEVWMGKGKGLVEYWVCKVKLGWIMFEIDGVFEDVVCEVFFFGVVKLLIKCKIVICLGE